MESYKKIKTHYLSISCKMLLSKQIIHIFLFLLEIIFIFIQIIEIYCNNHKLNNFENKLSFMPISSFLIVIKSIPKIINTIIYDILILIILIYYFIFNNCRVKNNNFILIMINLMELFFYRILSLFIFNYFFAITNIYFIVNILLTITYIFILFLNFYFNHLSKFFPTSLVNYPYDFFSMIIDLFLLVIKVFLSISLTNSNEKISQLFFYLSIIILFILIFYLTNIIIYKSYYLMNNCILNKFRYSTLLSFCIIVILMLIIDKSKVFNNYFILCYFNLFSISTAFIGYIYDPYKFSKFDKDNNIENIFYYLFILDRNKNKYFLIEEKIEEHLSLCNKCNLCKKYNNLINKGKEQSDLYTIISNCQNQSYNLINKIIREIKKNGKNSIKNNSFYLINIIYIYYLKKSQNEYNSSLNIELLFELLNSENPFLEEHKITLEYIKYSNDFFIKANGVIKIINEIIKEKNIQEKYRNFFILGEELKKLNYRETESNNFNYNRNNNLEDLSDSSNLLTICSLFYEELFNESISNSGIYLRNNLNLLEELINKNNKNNKQITLEINISSFYVKIIRAGGEINKYENNNFFNFFPSNFKNKQINEMKNILFYSNEDDKMKSKENKHRNIKNKEREKQYINFNFIIEQKENDEIFYKILKLKLSLILLPYINNKIYLNGIYSLDNNIIISEKRKNEEVILLFGKKELSKKDNKNKYNNNIIKKIKNNKYFNGNKLVKNYECYIGCTKYNIYHIQMSSKNNSTENNYKKFKSNFSENKESFKENNYKSFINDEIESQSSSEKSSAPNHNYISYNRKNKQTKKENDLLNEFKNVKCALTIFFLGLLIFIIFQYLLLSFYQQKSINQVNFFFLFKDYINTFDNLFFSVMSLCCTASSINSKTCINYVDILTDSLYKIKYQNLNSQTSPQFIVFSKYLFAQNEVLINLLNSKLNKLINYLSNEDSKINYFNSYVFHYKINQNFTKKIKKLSLSKENITFNDFILLLNSRFTILTKDIENIFQPIYILNKTGEETFNNIYLEEKLSLYQENIYLMILDYKPFNKQIDLMITEVLIGVVELILKLKSFIYFIMNFILVFIFIFIILLVYYITIYFIIIFKVLKIINNNLRERIGDLTLKELLEQKIYNLKLLLQFYDNDIKETIKNLNKIYDDYNNYYNLKIKEELKLYKKVEIKEFQKNNNNEGFLKSFNQIKKYKLYKLSGKGNSYLYSILFIIIISIIFYIITLDIWNSYFNKNEIIQNWIPLSNKVTLETNKLMLNLLLMIYNNQTFKEFSSSYESNDYISNAYTKLSYLYQAEKYKKSLYKIIELKETKMSYNCSAFYENLNNDFFKSLLDLFIEEQEIFNDTVLDFCKVSKVMEFENYNTIYLKLYNLITTSMENFKNSKYDDIIKFIDNYKIYKIEMMYLLTYIYLLDLMNQNIKTAVIGMGNMMKTNIIIFTIIYLLLLIIFIFFTYFIYIRNINKGCENFIHIKNVFNICNIKE